GAGITATADSSRDYAVDTEVSASITIDTIAGDDIVNAAESGADVTVTGTVGGDVQEGDTVTITVGENSYEAQVGADGTWSVAIAGSVLAAGASIAASVTTTDAAGNTTTADTSRDYSVDTEVSASITIDTIAGDDIVNAAESGADVTVTGTVGGDVQEGDTVTITVGENSYEAQVGANGTWSVAIAGSVLAAGASIAASVTTTDAAGNTTTADTSRDYAVDTEVSATISIDTIAGDDIINAVESGADVTVTGTVGGDVREGDTVTVTVGEASYEAAVGADGTWSVARTGAVLGANGEVAAAVSTTDGAGNTTSADTSRDYAGDTEVSASITIGTVAGEDIINAVESGGDVTVTGTVGGDVQEGDTVTVTVGEASYEAAVGADGTWSVAIAGSVLAAGASIAASVTTTDAAGNTTTADTSRDYAVDTDVSATITIDTIAGDDIINAAESGADV